MTKADGYLHLGAPARRLAIAILLVAFFSLEPNPLVRLEALLGLSPAPLEKHLGIRSLFSGMTEGVVRTLHGDLREAIRANVFSPLVVPLLMFFLWIGKVPALASRRSEISFFCGFVLLSVIVNIVH